MRFATGLLFLGLAVAGCGQTPLTAFSPAERDAIRRYWSAPDRYTIGLPADALDRGIWQVRLTTTGSQWLWDFQRGKKGPAPETAAWEPWVNARVQRDRWEAAQIARRANERVTGRPVLPNEDSVPASEPADPGAAPEAMLATFGNPPKFAASVTPMEYAVRFDDLALTFRDYYAPKNVRYAFYRYDQGVGSAGMPVRNYPSERLNLLFGSAGVTESEARVMRAVSLIEGGFDAINTYDTGYVSVGFIQFACLREGGGSLGQVLLRYKADYPDEYETNFRRFGLDVTPEGLLVALDVATGAELTGPAAAAKIIDDKRLIAVFQRAGRISDGFNATQIRVAKAAYLPLDEPLTLSLPSGPLSIKVRDLFRSEAAWATLMDRKVNTGDISAIQVAVDALVAQVKPTRLEDLLPYERALVETLKFRKNYLIDRDLSQPAPSPRVRNRRR